LTEIVKIRNRETCFLDLTNGDINQLPPGFFEFFFEFSSLFESNYFDRKIKLAVNSKMREKKDLLLVLFQQASTLFLSSPSEQLLGNILRFLDSLSSLKTDLLGKYEFVTFLFSLCMIAACDNQTDTLDFVLTNCVPDLGVFSDDFKGICFKMSTFLKNIPLPDDLLRSLLSSLEKIFNYSLFSNEMLSTNAHSFVSSLLSSLSVCSGTSFVSVSLLSVHLFLSFQLALTLLNHPFDPVFMLNLFAQNFPFFLYFKNRVSKTFFSNLDIVIESLVKDDFSEFTNVFEVLQTSIKENKTSFPQIAQIPFDVSQMLIPESSKNGKPEFDKSKESFLLFDVECFTEFSQVLPKSESQSIEISQTILNLVKHFQIKFIEKSRVTNPSHLKMLFDQLKKDKDSISTGDEFCDDDHGEDSLSPTKKINQTLIHYIRNRTPKVVQEKGILHFAEPTFSILNLVEFREELSETSNYICGIIEELEGNLQPFIEWVFEYVIQHNLTLVNSNQLSQDCYITIFESCVLFLKHILFRFEDQQLHSLFDPFCKQIFTTQLGLMNNPLIALSAIDFLIVFFSEIYNTPPSCVIPIEVLQILFMSFDSPNLVIRSIRAFNSSVEVLQPNMMTLHVESFTQFSQVLLLLLQKKFQNEMEENKTYADIPHTLLVNFFGNVLKFDLNLFSVTKNEEIFSNVFMFVKTVFNRSSSSKISQNLQVLLFNKLLSFQSEVPNYHNGIHIMVQQIITTFTPRYLECLLLLLEQEQFRNSALHSLQEFVSIINFNEHGHINALFEFYEQALNKSVLNISDLFDSFSDFLIGQKENQVIKEWLASSFESFCTSMLMNVSQNCLHPPLKYLLNLFLSNTGSTFLE
jgi:hypothetical protein